MPESLVAASSRAGELLSAASHAAATRHTAPGKPARTACVGVGSTATATSDNDPIIGLARYGCRTQETRVAAAADTDIGRTAPTTRHQRPATDTAGIVIAETTAIDTRGARDVSTLGYRSALPAYGDYKLLARVHREPSPRLSTSTTR